MKQSSKSFGPTYHFFPNNNNMRIITVIKPPTLFWPYKMDLLTPSNLPQDASSVIIKKIKHLSTGAMQDIFRNMPYQWQLEIMSHLS
jgi:hypothetical protein